MSRKKVTVHARELSEMDVNRISLVKRGANRVPFRIVKSDGESTMLDISKIFFMKKETQTITPAVVAVALAKGADVEAYTKALTDAGFKVDHVNETDQANTLMLGKSDEMEDAVAFKISEDCALVIAGIQKGLMAWPDTNSFVENITKAGFAPSYRIANEILTETVSNIMFSEGDAEETKTAISKALTDFQGYVEAVLSTVPVQAFKAEAAIIEVEKGMLNEQDTQDSLKAKAKKAKKDKAANSKDKKDTEKSEDDDDADADSDSGDTESSDSEGADDDASTGDDVVAEKDSKKDDAEGAEKDKADPNVELLKTLSGLTETIEGLKTSVDSGNKKLSDRIDGLEEKVKKTDEALAGTVHSEDSEDDSSNPKKKTDAQKTDGEVNWDSVLDFGEGVELS